MSKVRTRKPRGPRPMPVRYGEEFLAEIQDKIRKHPRSDCMFWVGAMTNGHPSVRRGGKQYMVRRLLFPDALRVLGCQKHTHCVNPDHLMPVASTTKRDAAIVRAYQAGASARDVGASFGLSGQQVLNIVRREGKAVRTPGRAM